MTIDEYIEREEIRRVYEKLTRSYVNGNQYIADWRFDEMIEKLPAADVAPVRHGRWVLLDECYNEGVYCSACHKKVYKKCYANQKIKSKFCPNCGAKMDGGAERCIR